MVFLPVDPLVGILIGSCTVHTYIVELPVWCKYVSDQLSVTSKINHIDLLLWAPMMTPPTASCCSMYCMATIAMVTVLSFELCLLAIDCSVCRSSWNKPHPPNSSMMSRYLTRLLLARSCVCVCVYVHVCVGVAYFVLCMLHLHVHVYYM